MTTASSQHNQHNLPSRTWSCLCRSLSFHTTSNRNRPDTAGAGGEANVRISRPTHNLQSHDSVLIGDGFPVSLAEPSYHHHTKQQQQQQQQQQPQGSPLKQTVRKFIRRASLSLRHGHGEKSPVVISGVAKKEKGRRRGVLLGDAESGIVLDDKDMDDSFYDGDSLKRLDFVNILPAEIAAQIMSYLDHKSLLNAEMVNRRWHEAAVNTHVWRTVFRNNYGPWESKPGKDWKKMFSVNTELHNRWARKEMSLKYLEGHSDSVYCVQFDDSKVITGSRDQTIRVWDIKSGECVKVLGPRDADVSSPHLDFHTASVLCLQFDDKMLVTGSSDSSCIVWSLPSYTPIGRLSYHTAGVLDVCFDEKHIVSCSKDTTICVWDRKTRRLVRQLQGHRGPVNAVAIRGNQIVSASGDALVKLWDLTTGVCIREFKGHHRGLACVQFSEDGATIVSGGNDQDIRVWDAATGECTKTLTGHKSLVRTLHLDTINRRIISGSYDATVKVWDLNTGAMICDIPDHHSTWILAAKADSRRIISTSQDSRTLMMDFGAGLDGLELLA